jgi:hypothetical protein
MRRSFTARAAAGILVLASFAGARALPAQSAGETRVPAAAQRLAPVTVTAKEDVSRKSYFIDADAIASSDRPLADATDIVTKLRPDMIWGRAGHRDHCPPVSNVWVNGNRIRLAPIDPSLVAEKRMGMRAARATPHLPPQGRAAIPLSVLSVLTSIKPAHIAEMRYHDCADLSIEENASASSIFVVLKAGIAFAPGIGSYVPAGSVSNPGAFAASAPPAYVADSLPAYRLRLIGVYSEETGEPLEGVEVVDVATGAKVATSSTGTACLVFMPEGAGTIRLVKTGYRTAELPVSISPADTVPITTVLSVLRD